VATYTYDDTFIVDSVSLEELGAAEAKAIEEVQKLNIADPLYVEEMVKARVYATLAMRQLENDGMGDKYAAYNKEFDRLYRLAVNSSPSNLGVVPLARG